MYPHPQLTPRYFAPSAWWEHVPIAHWLIARLKPQTVVELGTENGVSLFAFCQASKQFGTGSFIYAVDTWVGDEHTGEYGDEVYNRVLTHQRMHYVQTSALLRQTFDEASHYFAEQTIDLLHVDGLHTYEAVRHDYETWLPKLKQNATILFHDINVREREFGVWEFWRQLNEDPQFCCLEVRNGSGLGIATLTAEAPDWHGELKESLEFLQSSGALFLELSTQNLSLQKTQRENNMLSAEVAALKQEITAQKQHILIGLAKEAETSDTETTRNGIATRLLRKLRSGTKRIRSSF